jgi:hypothetical protein
MKSTIHVCRGEQGAVFVQVGIAIFVLMAFNVFVIDYGMMWIARGQAQNAADAGALAGAVARGYDDFSSSPSQSGVAANSARNVARGNLVWNEVPTPVVDFVECPTGVVGQCVRVDVYRNGEQGSNSIDAIFGPILGVNSLGVRATATAVSEYGNATNCLRPIALPDRWLEAAPDDDEFNLYIEPSPGTLISPASARDSYAPPTGSNPGNTTVPEDMEDRTIWELDRPYLTAPITQGLFVPLVLPGPGTFEDKVRSCSGQTVRIGQRLAVQAPPAGQTLQDAFSDLINGVDRNADWDDTRKRITGSCAPECAPVSPRLIPIALFDPARFQLGRASGDWTQAAVGCDTNSPCVTITNIVGFFVHGSAGPYGPHGHFLRFPGLRVDGAPTYPAAGSWLTSQRLVR